MTTYLDIARAKLASLAPSLGLRTCAKSAISAESPRLGDRKSKRHNALLVTTAAEVADSIDTATGWAEITLPTAGGSQRIMGEPAVVEAAVREHLAAAALAVRTRDYFATMPADDAAWLDRPRGEPCPWCRLRSGHSARCREQSAAWATAGTMPVGKHKGRLLTDLPGDYLAWCLANMGTLDNETRAAIRATLDLRGQAA